MGIRRAPAPTYHVCRPFCRGVPSRPSAGIVACPIRHSNRPLKDGALTRRGGRGVEREREVVGFERPTVQDAFISTENRIESAVYRERSSNAAGFEACRWWSCCLDHRLQAGIAQGWLNYSQSCEGILLLGVSKVFLVWAALGSIQRLVPSAATGGWRAPHKLIHVL